MRLMRGSHIVVPKLFDHPFAYLFQLADSRISFAIPYEQDFTLIGTTDRDHQGSVDAITASSEEIAYLCEGVNGYFKRQITPQDVVWSYSGLRPLLDQGSGKPEAATRGYSFELEGGTDGTPPLLSVFGGKITTYRHLAEAALAELAPYLPTLSARSWTASEPLPGGDFPMQAIGTLAGDMARDFPFLEPVWIDRLAKAYGTLARLWLADARSLADLGHHFGHGLTSAEVDYLMAQEWARRAGDILSRRTKLGLRFDAAQIADLAEYLQRPVS